MTKLISIQTELYTTVVSVYIYTMKTSFDFNFDLYQAVNQHRYSKTWKQREAVNQKAFLSLLVFRKQSKL